MGRRETVDVTVLASDSSLYEGTVFSVMVPTGDGEVAILPYHTPTIMLLTEGAVKVVSAGGATSVATIHEGVLSVEDNKVKILVSR